MGPSPVSRKARLPGNSQCMLRRRMYSTSSRLALAHSAQLGIKPSARVVVPMPAFPPTEQYQLIVAHELPHLVMRVARPLILVVLMLGTAYPPCILSLFLFSHIFNFLLIHLRLLFRCLGNLMQPCSCRFHFLACVFFNMSMRACAFSFASGAIVLAPGMAMIIITHFILEFACDVDS